MSIQLCIFGCVKLTIAITIVNYVTFSACVPHTGCGAVMRPDSFVHFGAM